MRSEQPQTPAIDIGIGASEREKIAPGTYREFVKLASIKEPEA